MILNKLQRDKKPPKLFFVIRNGELWYGSEEKGFTFMEKEPGIVELVKINELYIKEHTANISSLNFFYVLKRRRLERRFLRWRMKHQKVLNEFKRLKE